MNAFRVTRVALSSVLLLALAGCVVNPLTGDRELGFVSMEQQISIGEQQYQPAQQMQGGTYQVDPELTEYVRSVGQKVAAHSGIDLPYEFVVLNNSVPNAWALPGGKLAINRGLLTELRNEAELAAVLGHEIVHAAGRHGAKAMERGIVAQAALLGVVIGASQSEYAGTAVGAAQLAAGLLNQRYGRNAEREADFYGTRFIAEAGYDPQAAVTLQETFVRLSEGRNPSWVEGLFSSHPPSTERVANNRSLVRQLRAEGFTDGEFGVEAYQAATRQLRKDAAAYAAYDEAREAAADDELERAETLISRAIELQGREPAFHGFRGDLRLAQRRYGDAVTNYQRAIERDPGYFGYYLGRGVARARQKSPAEAKADLDRSVELLPTAVAYNELGRIAEAEGDVDTALRYYQAAGQSPGEAGQAALVSGLRLDVPRQPSKYLDARVSLDDRGRLVMQVVNRTPVNLGDVEVRVEAMDAQGRVASFHERLPRIAPGAAQLVLVADGAGQVVDARALVTQARVVQ